MMAVRIQEHRPTEQWLATCLWCPFCGAHDSTENTKIHGEFGVVMEPGLRYGDEENTYRCLTCKETFVLEVKS